MAENNLPYVIYAEMTPNPATMKFVANHLLAPDGRIFDYASESDASNSPLAQRLFSFPFVSGVFITQNFITITKSPTIKWDDITMELREYLSNFLNSGYDVFTNIDIETKNNPDSLKQVKGQTDHRTPETPAEQQIIEILDEYVRPAVEGDGGAIHFKSFQEGKLSLVLKGSCSGCPSSSLTLQAGIQSLFQRMMPEVEEVIAVEE